MTVTTSGKPARRRAVAIRALGAVLAGALLGGSIVMTAAALPAGAAAETPTPTPSPTPEIPVGTTVFTLSPVGNGIVAADEGLSVTITLQNATTRPTPAHAVTLRIGTDPITDRRVLDAWLDGDLTAAVTNDVATTALAPVEPDSEASKGLLVPADDPALANLPAGVYALAAMYEDEDGATVTSTSVMVIHDDTATEASVGVIVPITAAPRTTGLLTADELTALTAPSGDLSNQLNAVEGTPAVLAVDPAIPAAIRVLGSSAPDSAVEWLDDLLELPNPRFALQFGDADPSAQIQAGLSQPLQPRSLEPYMSASDFIEAALEEEAPATSPTPSAVDEGETDAAPALPTNDDLLDIGPAAGNIYWPAPDSLTSDVLTTLGEITVDDEPSLTVVASDETAPGSSGSTMGARVRVDDAQTLVYDSSISDALRSASLQGSGALRTADLAAATASLVLATADARGTPLLVTVGREPARSNVSLRTAITAVFDAPGVAAADLDEITGATARRTQIVDAEISAERTDAVSRLLGEEAEIARFATVLDEPSLLIGPERAELLQLLSVEWTADAEVWPIAVAEHREQTAATLDSVALLPSSTINLFGSGAGLGFWVRNDLPYPVNVTLFTTPDDLRLDVQRATPVTATASSNTRVEVPVQARVANGEVTLELQLRSPSSVPIGEPESVQVNVRAEWETVGVAALSIVVGGLLVAGIVRTVLRIRAGKRDATEADAAEMTDEVNQE